MIGDPRPTAEREIIPVETVLKNVDCIKKQVFDIFEGNCEVVNNSIRIPYDRSAINAIYLFELVAFNADDTGYVFDADNSPFTVEGNAELVSRPNAQATFTGDFTIHMGLHVD